MNLVNLFIEAFEDDYLDYLTIANLLWTIFETNSKMLRLSAVANLSLLIHRVYRKYKLDKEEDADEKLVEKREEEGFVGTTRLIPELPTQYYLDTVEERCDSAEYYSEIAVGKEVYVVFKGLPIKAQFKQTDATQAIFRAATKSNVKVQALFGPDKVVIAQFLAKGLLEDQADEWFYINSVYNVQKDVVQREFMFLFKLFDMVANPEPGEVEGTKEGVCQGFDLAGIISTTCEWLCLPITAAKNFFLLDKMRSFNTISASVVNFRRFMAWFISFMPECIKNYFSPMLAKEWLSKQCQDINSPAAQAMIASLEVSVAVESFMGNDVIEMAKKKATEKLIEFQKQLITEKIIADSTILRWIKELKAIAGATATGEQRKREPFCIRISGAPGVGKSTYWGAMVSGLFKGIDIDKIVNYYTYSRQPGMDYWDGYNPKQHKIILYDDFGQAADDAEYLEFIELVSKAAFLPNFADIDPNNVMTGCKGTQGDPKIVVLLTNCASINSSVAIKAAGAVERRPHINIDLVKCDFGRVDIWNSMQANIDGRRTDVRMPQERAVRVEGLRGIQKAIVDAYIQYLKANVIIENVMSTLAYDGNDGIDILNNSFDKLVEEKTHMRSKPQLTEISTKEVEQESELEYESGSEGSTEGTCEAGPGVGELLFNSLILIGAFKIGQNVVYPAAAGMTRFTIRVWNATVGRIWTFFQCDQFPTAKVIPTLLTCTFAGVMILGLMYAGSVLSSLITGYFGEAESGTTVTKGVTAPKIISRAQHARLEGESDADRIGRIIRKNQVNVKSSKWTLSGLFVKGRLLLINRHFFTDPTKCGARYFDKLVEKDLRSQYMDDGSVFTIQWMDGNKTDQVFKRENVYELYNDGDDMSDLVIYECDTRIPLHRNITTHFLFDDEHLDCKLIRFMGVSNIGASAIERSAQINDPMLRFKFAIGNQKWLIAKCFSYNVPTTFGDCGSVILLEQNQPKIIGIHIGSYNMGGHQSGTATRVTQTILNSVFAKIGSAFEGDYESRTIISKPLEFDLVESRDERLKDGLFDIGFLKGVKSYPVGKTTIKKSPLFDKIVEHTTAPSITNIYDKRLGERDIMIEGLNKYGSQPKRMKKELYDVLVESFRDDYNIPSNIKGEVISLEEAINGSDRIGGLDMTTSAGYPFSLLGMGGEKRKLFDLVNDKWVPNKALQQEIDFLEQCILDGKVPFYPWVDCLKDERRTLDKIAACKTRIFSAAPIALVLLQKRYYGLFLQHMNAIRIKTFNRVGMNKDSIEWNDHYHHLNQVNDKGSDVDYEKKDGNNRIDNVEHFYDCGDNWYKDQGVIFGEYEILVRKFLKEVETHSHHVYYSKKDKRWKIYQLNGKTNSGTLITINMNSHTDELDMRLAWLLLAGPEYQDIYYYRRFVRTAIVGDDLVITISPHVQEWFNMNNIARVLLDEGSILSAGDHTTEIKEKPLEDCVFLKNTTGEFAGYKVPLMEINAMLEPINWIRESEFMESEDQACEDNCNAVLRNVFWYGRTSFNNVRNAIKGIKPEYRLLSFGHLQEQFFNNGLIEDPLSLSERRSKQL